MYVLLAWPAAALAVAATGAVVPGIHVTGGPGSWLWIALVVAMVNLVVGSLLRLLAAPLMVMTAGLVGLAINGWLFLLADAVLDSFTVDGFGAAMLGSIVNSAIVTVLLLLGASTQSAGHDIRVRPLSPDE